ncbi:MAG: hypothetical protein A3D65_03395 [Candidatus Lloydbacteria bacterium RIFCSPHIGHO2_02_FULL_50_13]|uniref:Uncharacterized protein n=1 Tax=Candidatus Lloydbacteria bacterium RIFCSPHIGHO2_02_FULL_50_13 TaxID=1798661 RepID=A0A1G2DBR1_9BACT|nr:MAG: hypothetical protein A3D65_03395 [Candidatus Lloydbacteria bacterium RIFCSPHIGHO2_02_FULL_50_13]
MKLVLFGGVHGVGKTTLFEKILVASGGEFRVIDPGELFWEHLYQKKDKTSDETEALAVELIEKECCLHQTVICNWHYAVWTPKGYVPQIAFPRLAGLIERVRPKCVQLVLVRASTDVVLLRREGDQAIKKRKIDRVCVEEEVAHTEHLYRLHHNVISSRVKTVSTVFDNTAPIDGATIERFRTALYETS